MSSETLLFIGGQYDGERRQVSREEPRVTIALQPKFVRTCLDVCKYKPRGQVMYQTYVRETICVQGERLEFFRYEGTPAIVAFKMLLMNYKP